MVSTEMPLLLVPFAYVAAASSCEGVVVVVSSEVASVVPLFFVAAMWCIEPMGGCQTVGGKCLRTDGHYSSKGQAHDSSSKYSLSLFSVPSMNIT